MPYLGYCPGAAHYFVEVSFSVHVRQHLGVCIFWDHKLGKLDGASGLDGLDNLAKLCTVKWMQLEKSQNQTYSNRSSGLKVRQGETCTFSMPKNVMLYFGEYISGS
jgi:hypothetical protein